MAGLDALKGFNQWINYVLVPRDNGKTDKLPVDPRTGVVCDSQNPAVWMTHAEAAATGAPIAFVFTEHDPFFFLDVDDCVTSDGAWNESAVYLCSLFAGCAVEVSQSGRGLHIFGIMPAILPHGCDNKFIHSQFYTERRFCALTYDSLTGDATFTPGAQLYSDFLAYYFPPGAMSGPVPTSEDWTTEPTPDWLGPDDDVELLDKMMRSRSVRSIVGAAITFRQLWNADADALAEIYPDSLGDQGRSFDWSQCDAALCSHLAFWTGKNCERIDRLWLRSELGQREKTIDRAEYRQRTILRAVAICSKVYRDRSLIQPADTATLLPPAAAGRVSTPATPAAIDILPESGPGDGPLRAGFQFLAPQDQIRLFNGCTYVRDAHRVWVPDGGMLKPEQFKAVYGGYVFAMDSINDKTTKNAWDAFTESQAVTNPWVHKTCFRPEHPSGHVLQHEGLSVINTYVPIETERMAGDPSPFLDLVSRLLPVERDRSILTAYMAACVQHPGVKFQWAPVIQGTFGNGKSLLTAILSVCVGTRYTHKVNPKDIDNVFNAWIENKLLIIIDEIKTGSSEAVIETLKWMITDDRVPIQAKGAGQDTGDNRANFIMCTNYKDGIVKKRDDRRFSVFFTAQQSAEDIKRDGMGGSYFPNFVEWLKTGGNAVINNYLREYIIPAELNPAGTCVRAPETSSNEQAVQESYGPIGQEIIESVNEGAPGFSGGWISTMALNRLVVGMRSRVTVNQRKEILQDLGYIKHPALPDGRSTRLIPSENGRPRLYVKNGHIAANIVDSAHAIAAYCTAQNYPALQVEPVVSPAAVTLLPR